MLIERKESKVNVNGMKATIPNDESMLSVFSNNEFLADATYSQDGWIYIDKKPVKKWFRSISDIRVWFPILEDVNKLHKRYQKVKKGYKKFLEEKFRKVYDDVVKVKKAHAKITHKYSGNYDPWWLFTVSETGISFDWVKKPEKPKNLEIGNNYYKNERRLEQYSRWVNKFRIVLKFAIDQKLSKVEGKTGEILQLTMNDEIFLFRYEKYSWNWLSFDSKIKTINW